MIRPFEFLYAAIAAGFLAAPAVAADSMEAEIDYLLTRVATSDCTFIRNGREHDAEAASDHLAMKRRRGSRYFDSAEEFIERIASKSSWTGKPYRIRCGGDEVTAGEWFTELLAEYRSDPDADADVPTAGNRD